MVTDVHLEIFCAPIIIFSFHYLLNMHNFLYVNLKTEIQQESPQCLLCMNDLCIPRLLQPVREALS